MKGGCFLPFSPFFPLHPPFFSSFPPCSEKNLLWGLVLLPSLTLLGRRAVVWEPMTEQPEDLTLDLLGVLWLPDGPISLLEAMTTTVNT